MHSFSLQNNNNNHDKKIDIERRIKNIERSFLNNIMKINNTNTGFIEKYWVQCSPETTLQMEHKEIINLITQFYIDNDNNRQKEILKCLDFNLNNNLIDKVYLITERTYSDIEMNISNHKYRSKIIQINIGSRLKYCDVFDIIENNNINGYIVLANSDIFFDDTLSILYKTGLIDNKKIYNQLRFEYDNPELSKCKIFGPRGDSQDSWIFHSKFNIEKSHRKLFNFELGIPACDNHIIYLFIILGFKVHNEPYLIKTYHNHNTEKRNYNEKTNRVQQPWTRLMPIVHKYTENWPPPNKNWWRLILEKRIIN